MWLELASDVSYASDARPDAAPVRLGSDRPHFDPVVRKIGIAAQQLRVIIYRIHNDIDIAIVIEISESRAARGARVGDPRSRPEGNVCEMAIVQILVKQLPLRVSRFRLELLDLRIDMPVANQDVRPAIVIHVKKSATPAKELGVRSQTRSKGRVLEAGAALVTIERRRIAGEVCFHDVEVAVHIVISSRNPHPRLRLAVGAERATRFNRDILKFAVLLVLIKRARGRIICYVDIRPAVVVEIRGQHLKTIRTIRAEDSCAFENIT